MRARCAESKLAMISMARGIHADRPLHNFVLPAYGIQYLILSKRKYISKLTFIPELAIEMGIGN